MQQWFAKFDLQKLDKLAPILFLILLLWLSWRLANLFWWFVAPPQLPTIQPVILGSQQAVLPNIVRFSLFEEQGKNPQAQQTQMNVSLKLEGVVLANPQYLSSAVIRVDNKVQTYRVSKPIESTDFTLAEVYWDRVIVRDGSGQTREVRFGDSNNPTGRPISGATHSQHSSNPPISSPQSEQSQAISQAIEQLQQDREQYLSNMGVNAGQNGFEITDRTPPALRARLGLRAGDRIVSVNGQTIGAGTNEAQLLEQIRRTGQAKIEIQRGNQTMTIQQNF